MGIFTFEFWLFAFEGELDCDVDAETDCCPCVDSESEVEDGVVSLELELKFELVASVSLVLELVEFEEVSDDDVVPFEDDEEVLVPAEEVELALVVDPGSADPAVLLLPEFVVSSELTIDEGTKLIWIC